VVRSVVRYDADINSARTGSPSTRPATLGTRSCRLDLLLLRLGRRGRRLWASK
jgi:hypothetical protein